MKNKGITLISLVVTVIILLILAGISIGILSGDNSIIKQAGNAKTQTDIAQEKEILEQATVVAMGKSKYGNVEKTYLDAELNKYSEIDGTAKVDEGIEVTFKSSRMYLIDVDGNVTPAVSYPLASSILNSNPSSNSEEEKSPYVNYTDFNGDTILCRLLYNDENGVEIISSNIVTQLQLGLSDTTVESSDFLYIGSGTMNDNSKKAAASYNRMITTLNEKAESYRNKTNGISDKARCVGSNVLNNEDIEETSYSNTFTYMDTYSWNNTLKVSDTNYLSDFNRMNELGICNINSTYYLASRVAISGSSNTRFGAYGVNNDGSLDNGIFLYMRSNGTSTSYGYQNGLRPVFHLTTNAKIKGGEGTEESPYILGK